MATSLVKSLTITNELGLHARAAAEFVKCSTMYDSDIVIEKGGVEANGKSITSILSLAIPVGQSFNICATGDDAHDAICAIEKLVEAKFGEAD
jgi:phosphocarrier protein HPr